MWPETLLHPLSLFFTQQLQNTPQLFSLPPLSLPYLFLSSFMSFLLSVPPPFLCEIVFSLSSTAPCPARFLNSLPVLFTFSFPSLHHFFSLVASSFLPLPPLFNFPVTAFPPSSTSTFPVLHYLFLSTSDSFHSLSSFHPPQVSFSRGCTCPSSSPLVSSSSLPPQPPETHCRK